MSHKMLRLSFLCLLALSLVSPRVLAQSLEQQLKSKSPAELVQAARESGNATRGAILFHGPILGCGKCHAVSEKGLDSLGPRLVGPKAYATVSGAHESSPQGLADYLVESILQPSAKIAPEYRAQQILTEDGKVLTGLALASPDPELVQLRDLESLQVISLPADEIAQQQPSPQSIMPNGLVNSLTNEAQFLDLLSYLLEIRAGGELRARELQPSAAQLAINLPEYEAHIDHAGIIADWNDQSLQRGEAIYMGLCVNCHGTLESPGSLATAMRFGEGKFKYGSDPYALYQTLTRGAGLMLPQPWMVPQQKYDVIHYLRSEFLKSHNPSQLSEINDSYLAGLPKGTERGPAPQKIEPWSQADYGPRLTGTFEIGSGGRNIAYKGIAIQLDANPGGVAHGQAWAIFDHDTMRVAGVWTSRGFIDWQGINFNGRHGIHPHIVGDILLANPTGPGWADPRTGEIDDGARVLGRDGRQYGPLPRTWAQFTGVRQSGRQSELIYRVGTAEVEESFSWTPAEEQSDAPESGLFARHMVVGAHEEGLDVVVATLPSPTDTWTVDAQIATNQPATADIVSTEAWTQFDGDHYFEIEDHASLRMSGADFSVRVNLTSTGDGTLFSRAPRQGPWAPGGQTLFVRDGHLCYDVGWVGVIQSASPIDDGKPHTVALSWNQSKGLATLWIDGVRAGKKKLQPKELLEDAVLRIGYTSGNFPAPSVLNNTELTRVQFFDHELTPSELGDQSSSAGLVADWRISDAGEILRDASGHNHDARPRRLAGQRPDDQSLVAGFESDLTSTEWRPRGDVLTLHIPPSDEPTRLTVWTCASNSGAPSAAPAAAFARRTLSDQPTAEIQPQPQTLFPEVLETSVELGSPSNGFAVDVLQIPKSNPWQARVRLTGLDFFRDPDRMAVCTWDGDVWLITGLQSIAAADADATLPAKLKWRRIAFGLFQPLGLKIIDETIYLTCRDQLVRLEDRDGDGEIDYYHCVNNDHQVTEHFHEFAMGLQTDAAGNFYYAKSARHALKAVVPHHGTLLRISADGEKTDILATGFRAANGVCMNPDGTFIVTDQEGHWNPKNRINWVHEGGFYGNMYGYHDVTDESDAAMQQPLCWITNAFDRSPAELLWVDSPAWGPLNGSLLNLSYGYGRVYVVPFQQTQVGFQGGMCRLPIPDLPTGIVRGRFSPTDHQLYLCGLSAWATNQTAEEGGLYRIRYTHQAAALPLGLAAHRRGLTIRFSEPLDPSTSRDPDQYAVEVWGLKRTKNYGSDHYDQHPLRITAVRLSDDRTTLDLEIPDVAPTWGMEIRLPIVNADGDPVERVIHSTVHTLDTK
jgi:putative heme-binding domain-containing protein